MQLLRGRLGLVRPTMTGSRHAPISATALLGWVIVVTSGKLVEADVGSGDAATASLDVAAYGGGVAPFLVAQVHCDGLMSPSMHRSRRAEGDDDGVPPRADLADRDVRLVPLQPLRRLGEECVGLSRAPNE
jgi:hypothetical protein